ncbi:MAG: hypothetical protein K6T88_22120, partial [Bacillus sp. (in: Bacteria)]|nr:hypothetical protein [Bacillus sp. (in: firmicutes)]
LLFWLANKYIIEKRQNISFINFIKNKDLLRNQESILHSIYEGQNSHSKPEKCPSSSTFAKADATY